MTSVVLVDDQAMVRDGLRLILELAGVEVVGEAADGEEGVRLVLEHRPDVVLMDLRMPRMDGIEATRQLVAAGCPTRILVLTTFDGEEHAYQALRAGAAGYLLKNAQPQELARAIRAEHAGEALLDPVVAARLMREVASPPPEEPLTPREREVLVLLAQGLANKQIAPRLGITEHTVKAHVAAIYEKLGAGNRAEAAVAAARLGLLLL